MLAKQDIFKHSINMRKKIVEEGVDKGRYTHLYAYCVSQVVHPVVEEVIRADKNRKSLAKIAYKLSLGEARDRQKISKAEAQGELYGDYVFYELDEFDTEYERERERASEELFRSLLADIKDFNNYDNPPGFD
jgi:hypothetical protein